MAARAAPVDIKNFKMPNIERALRRGAQGEQVKDDYVEASVDGAVQDQRKRSAGGKAAGAVRPRMNFDSNVGSGCGSLLASLEHEPQPLSVAALKTKEQGGKQA